MLQPYGLPHECESAEIADLLSQLGPQQRRALRSYVWQVELGEQTVTGWLASDTCPVSRQSWYRRGGNYWEHTLFRAALERYVAVGLKWRTSQDRRDVERARRSLLLAAPRAAERLIEHLDGDVGVFFRVVERWTDSPLPSQEIIQEEVRDDKDGKPVRFYLVRQTVVNLDRLLDPQFSRRVKKFTDSPRSGISLELHDSQRAAESILDRADLETASKAPAAQGAGVVVVIPDNGRADRDTAGGAATGSTDEVPIQSG